LRQETGQLLYLLNNELGKIERKRPHAGYSLSLLIAKLLSNALSIGFVAPASSESAKAAVAANKAQRARAAKTQTPKRAALDKAFMNALSAKRGGRAGLWTLAGHMKPDIDKQMKDAGYQTGITQQAIYQRLRKHPSNQRSNRN